jgi:hypothetical protein
VAKIQIEPEIADEVGGRALTAYDERHLATYLRLLDAEAEGAEWQDLCEFHAAKFGRSSAERRSRYAAFWLLVYGGEEKKRAG